MNFTWISYWQICLCIGIKKIENLSPEEDMGLAGSMILTVGSNWSMSWFCVWFPQTQSRLQAVETSLASAVEARDKYQMTNRMLEHSLEENRSKLQEESTCYRAAEKKTESLQSQLNDSRRERVGRHALCTRSHSTRHILNITLSIMHWILCHASCTKYQLTCHYRLCVWFCEKPQ